ncbi:28S ribosomal protein S35, mitochondrial [Eumeta japonica]|uniref:28S ribosomal protein S35, mitochondrial n=1 Tax=Eumeta variegata TaxID=151549 RepID=A0A4C1WIV5_EUMVA|nr:28S ribosomal protein S35, mitochondrial [Eumeta japonica]
MYKPKTLNINNNAYVRTIWRLNSTAIGAVKDTEEEEFRVLDILKKKQRQERKTMKRADVQPDRADRMAPDQNWGNVWPGPRSFHPSSVPLPIRQGYALKGAAPPGKKANAELMKIPNFLHLTPPVIKSQCEALKQFCTEWPKLLNSNEAIEKHYPVEIITSDYCHGSPSIRNPLARIVTLRVKLSSLELDKHARDKFLRLIEYRYDEETDLVTITADRCPMRKQNLDYANYLLTACYHESWAFEEWERDKTEEDMEYYDWDKNASKRSLVQWYYRFQGKDLPEDVDYVGYDISEIPNGEQYKMAVNNLFNEGEKDETLLEYTKAVRKLFGLPDLDVES